MQISVAAVECDVPHVSHHDVLHTNVVLPEKRKRENNVFCIFLFCWGGGKKDHGLDINHGLLQQGNGLLYMGHTLYLLSRTENLSSVTEI